MRMKIFAVSFVLLTAFALSATAAFGADMFSGTWKQNIAASKYGFGQPPQSNIQKIQAVDNGIRMVQDSVEAKGQKAHYDTSAKFDGKDYPNIQLIDGKPDPRGEMVVSAKKIDDYTFELTFKAKGKVVFIAKNVISKDGKARTATQTVTTDQGQTLTNTLLFEKQ